MKKIDIHTHILPEEWPDFTKKFGYGDFPTIQHVDSCNAQLLKPDGTLFRKITQNCWDPSVRIQECDDTGVDIQVLSTVPVLFSYWAKPEHGLEISRFLNDQISMTVESHPDRFYGLGTLPMQAPDLAVRELERCVNNLGLCGVEIGSHINQWNLSDPELFPVFEAASDLGAAIFVHPWDMMGKERMSKYWLPWLVGMPAEVSLAICSIILGGVLEKLPNLRIAFAHGGGAFPGTLGRIEHGFQVRPDLCAVDTQTRPSDFLGRFYVDSLVHDADALRFVMKTFGEDFVALGSDYPFPLGEQSPGSLIDRMSDIREATKEKLFCMNALKWLGREDEL